MDSMDQRANRIKGVFELEQSAHNIFEISEAALAFAYGIDPPAELRHVVGDVVNEVPEILPVEHASQLAVNLHEAGSIDHEFATKVHQVVQAFQIDSERLA